MDLTSEASLNCFDRFRKTLKNTGTQSETLDEIFASMTKEVKMLHSEVTKYVGLFRDKEEKLKQVNTAYNSQSRDYSDTQKMLIVETEGHETVKSKAK